ncbi:MAG: hypothetical protein IPM57_00545 [Oligoflexia bacterium]|nr:hypothetical protein [Oligoflexia bacterium]
MTALNKKGQSSIEASLSVGLLLSVLLLGLILASQFWAKNILTKWAAFHSRCIAVEGTSTFCELKTKSDLKKYFYFKDISLNSIYFMGTYQTKISATFLGLKNISSFYNYQASEFKRTSRDQ